MATDEKGSKLSAVRGAFEVEQRPVREEDDALFPRVAGSLIGAAAGDALGWITEFVRGRDHLVKLYRTDWVTEYRPWQKTTGGRFNAYIDHINPGEYSDDTQLTLCIARSIRNDGTADADHFAKQELPLWLDYARGAGLTITAAARALKKKTPTWNNNFFTYRTKGGQTTSREAGANGAAMRVGPLALANVEDPRTLYSAVWRTSITTHGHPRALFGAALHAEALRYCADAKTDATRSVLSHLEAFVGSATPPLDDPGVVGWLRQWNSKTREPFEATWETVRGEVRRGLDLISRAKPASGQATLELLGCFDPATKGSGVATVLAGLLIFVLEGDNFEKAVVTAVNQLGTDTDTIAAFVGGLCGAYHGYNALPESWAVQLQDYDYFMRIATELSRVAKRTGIGSAALLPDRRHEPAAPNLLELLHERNIAAHERVHHPLFGSGWVEAVDVQRLRRKDGAQVVLARVAFDIGQSCKFRYMESPGSRRRSATAKDKDQRQEPTVSESSSEKLF